MTKGPAREPARSPSWRRTLVFDRGCGLENGAAALSAALADFDRFAASVDGLGAAGAHDLRLACDELAANVLRHVSATRDAVVNIELDVEADSARLRVRDNGPAFDPFSQADPHLGGDVRGRRVGGVGLYLVRTLFPRGRCIREDGWNVSEVRRRLGNGGVAGMGAEGASPE